MIDLVPLKNHHFDRADRAARVFWAHYQEIQTLRYGSKLLATSWDDMTPHHRDAIRQAMGAALDESRKA